MYARQCLVAEYFSLLYPSRSVGRTGPGRLKAGAPLARWAAAARDGNRKQNYRYRSIDIGKVSIKNIDKSSKIYRYIEYRKIILHIFDTKGAAK